MKKPHTSHPTARTTTTTPARGGNRRGGRRGGRRRAGRRRPARFVLPLLLCSGAVVAVAVVAGLLPRDADPRTDLSAPSVPESGSSEPAAPVPAPSPPASPSQSPAAASPPAPGPAVVPETGPGTFKASTVSGPVHGSGTVRRYRVEAEDGTGIDPDEAARAVDAVLGDRRGWTADPKVAFRLTESGPVEFTVRIATPATTDRLCAVVTAELKGETNCRAGHEVVVNLRRWLLGSPQFDGPPAEYRALIINHEVGHELGRGHETCPGAGLPAPAMMQQIKGLLGCRSNAWPFDAQGNYAKGPAVP
ncbi:DUF3152 domain-containing protein [Streptomyces sp. ICC4]|uniref:DUF3152 domain-containing protein n=1 Tax=Streptomyces sp. ICC4 TaxID=2099584 RepID=UPI000DC7D378|nr:DUF3152 domain-containing protein [Streptomyces sp. ICC4]AWZ05505.1 hypothetical protein DRB89_13475 [Streptomyces sp. ICC4]